MGADARDQARRHNGTAGAGGIPMAWVVVEDIEMGDEEDDV